MAITDSLLGTINSWGIWGAILVFAVVILLVIIAGFVIWWIIMRKLFYKKIIIFEKVGGQIQVTKRDVGRDIRLGEAGDYIIYTRHFKKFLPPAEIQTGPNTFWYYIREDGEWINIGISDIDVQMKKAKAHFLDKEMRFARTGMQKNLRERLNKPGFWSKYGAMIMWTVYLAIVGIMTYLLFDKWIELAGTVQSMLETQRELIEASRDILQALDNIKSGGEGLVPAV